MTQGTGEVASRRCPRCGGRMAKPAGSSLYWHADNNHPRCDITNIVDSPSTLAAGASSAVEQSPEKGTNSGGKRKK